MYMHAWLECARAKSSHCMRSFKANVFWSSNCMSHCKEKRSTVMCFCIGTPKIIDFPFVPNGKLIIFRCPKM